MEHAVPETDPIVVRARTFVSSYLCDGDSDDEVRGWLRSDAADRPARRRVEEGLRALTTVLDEPRFAWYVTWIAEMDANRGLDDPREVHARAILSEFAGWAREALKI